MWRHLSPPSADRPDTGASTSPWPSTRSCTAACLVGADWFHFGGLGEFRHNDLWCFSLETLSWTLRHPGSDGFTSAGAPPKRCKASLVWHGPCLYLFGGWAAGRGDAGKLNDLWAFNLDAGTWSPVAPQRGMPPACRSAHSAVVVGDEMIVFGGIGANKFGDTFVFSFQTHTWRQLAGAGPAGPSRMPPRSSYGSLHVVGDSIVLFGGLTCGQLNDVIAAKVTSAGDWAGVPVAPGGDPPPFKRGRHCTAVAVVDTCSAPLLFVFGGTNLRTRDNGLYAFNTATRVWRRIPATTPPPPMEGAAMCIAPDQRTLFVYGGLGKGGWPRSIYCLDLHCTTLLSHSPTEGGGGGGGGDTSDLSTLLREQVASEAAEWEPGSVTAEAVDVDEHES